MKVVTAVPRQTAVKALQLPDSTWVVLSADETTFQILTDADFQAQYAIQ